MKKPVSSRTTSTSLMSLPTNDKSIHPHVKIRTYKECDRAQIVELWVKTGLYHPDNDPNRDIDRKVADSPELFFVATEEERVIGTVMVGYEGHRGWINYLGVLPECQGKGIGRELMTMAEKALGSLGCAKINLQIRKGNTDVIGFYNAIGYVIEDVISMEMRLQFDN
jgi:ribosomal protein S18 acetylase RimI-like enzyme